MSMSMNSGRSSRIPQLSFRRASTSSIMDASSLKTLNETHDAAVASRQESTTTTTANRSDSGIGSSASSRRKNSLQRNHSMYERTEVGSTKTITFRQQNTRQQSAIIEKVDAVPEKTAPKKSGLNPLGELNFLRNSYINRKLIILTKMFEVYILTSILQASFNLLSISNYT